MNITRAEREELKALSKEIFGKSSKYQMFLDGIPEVITKTTIEEVPGENGAPATTKEVKVPVLYNGVKQSRIRYFSVEETKAELLKMKAQLDDIRAQMKKQQEEQEAKKAADELAKKVQEDASGSAAQ